MKCLTIREPYASLISQGIKKIETRSWKTNYRGKIYIHAGIYKYNNSNEKINSLIKNFDLNYGKIVCEAELIDCILMTEDFIKKIKKENSTEYLIGNYQVGRYAWILDNIKIIENSKVIKGKLGLWNIEGD